MKILFFSDLKGRVSSGMSWSVPARIAAQAKIDDVLWVNLTETSMPHWLDTGVYHTIGEYGKCTTDVLPDSFNRPDLVVFEGVYYIKFVKLARELRRKGIPYVIVPRSMLTHFAVHNGKYLKKAVANILFFNSFIHKAAAIQYLTEKEYQDSGDKWNICHIIVPNGFDAPAELNRKSNDEESIRCSFIGRLDIYQKGLDLLVQACSNIQEQLRKAKFHLTLYGANWQGQGDKLAEQIQKLKMDDIICLGGEIRGEAKSDCLLASDMFIMTSRFEGMPMGLIEALAYGVPAFVTPGTNFCDKIEEYDAGWVSGDSVEDITQTLSAAVNERASFKKKSENARNLALKYKWNDLALAFHNKSIKIISDIK